MIDRMWAPESQPWQYELLDRMKSSSIDLGQIDESLKKTPTERVEHMRAFLNFLEEVQRAREH